MPLSEKGNAPAAVPASPAVGLWQREKAAWSDCLRDAARTPREPRIGWSVALFGIAICAFLYWRDMVLDAQIKFHMDFTEYNLLNTACILGLPLIFTLLCLRRDPTESGMTVGDTPTIWRYCLVAFALFLPVVIISSATHDSQSYYLGWMDDFYLGGSKAFIHAYYDKTRDVFFGGQIDYGRFAYHELVMCFYMFGWEYFFRGFLLNGFRRFLPLWPAIVLQTLFFATLHLGKPVPELLSSIPGGVLMALLAIRCRSFVPCFLLHFLVSAANDGSVLFMHFHASLPHALSHLFPHVFDISPAQK